MITKRDYFDLFESRKEELDASFGLVWQAKDFLDEKLKPDAALLASIGGIDNEGNT
jgi:hypothetical protein